MIEHYSFGKMVIDGVTYEKDLILSDAGIQSNWWRQEGHRLSLSDLREALDQFKPELLIAGTGRDGLMKIDPALEPELMSLGIRFDARPTAEAVEQYNQSIRARLKVMGAFHLTC